MGACSRCSPVRRNAEAREFFQSTNHMLLVKFRTVEQLEVIQEKGSKTRANSFGGQ